MPFQRFVETGRVAYVSDGPEQGKLVTIVDVIDQNRVLVDGPGSNVPRGQMRLSQLHLTKFRLQFPYTGSTRVVRKAWKTNKIDEKWQETMWARKVEAKKKRAALSDFDRFKLRKARQIRNKLRTDAFFRLKKKSKKSKVKTTGAAPKAAAKKPAKPAKNWSTLDPEERTQLDSRARTWYNPRRRQLYRPLREALIRWENIQDTQGAPGCEPGMVSFSCDPQLEEELVNVICSLEMMFSKTENKVEATVSKTNEQAKSMEEVPPSARDSPGSEASPRDRTPHSVHSCGYITDSKNSDDELGGYLTN